MEKTPFHKSLRAKLLLGYVLIVFAGSVIGAYVSVRIAEDEFRMLLNRQFQSTMNQTENFIDLVGQTALIWANEVATDPGLLTVLREGDRDELAGYVSGVMESVKSDSIVIVDKKGRVFLRGHAPGDFDDSLMSVRLVRDAVEKGEVGTSIISVDNTFIIYSSSLLRAGPESEVTGALLLGYEINERLIDNMKKNTDVEISVIRERAVMTTTLRGEGWRVENLPIPYLDYQMLLTGQSRVESAEFLGKKYFITARNLGAMESNQPGSMLLAYSQEPLLETKERITNRYIVLFLIGFLISIAIWYFLTRSMLNPINKLVKITKNVADGKLESRIDVTGADEFGMLSNNFNAMIDSLAEKDLALRAYSENLEKEVRSRTTELEVTIRELVETHSRHDEAQEIAHLGHWSLDRKTNELDWSEEVYRIFEVAGSSVTYEAFIETVHPDDRELVKRTYEESVKDKIPYDLIHRLLMKDGTIKYVNERCMTIYDSDGTPLRSIGTIQDISVRKRAEEAIRAIYKSTTVASGETFYDMVVNTVAEWLDADCVILGELKDVKKDHIESLSMILDGKKIDSYSYSLAGSPCENVKKSGFCNYERGVSDLFPDDIDLQEMSAESYIGTPLVDRVGNVMGVFCSISRRSYAIPHHAMVVFETLGAVISSEIEKKRAQEALVVAKYEAEEANRAKSDFIATMSHEIRTPMNAIIGMSDLLEETGLEGDQKEFVESIKFAGDNLLQLINDVLDISKIEAGQLVLEEIDFDLRQLVERIVGMLSAHANSKGLQLSCQIGEDVPPAIKGDPNRLRQVLVNIISNAIKFTHDGDVAISAALLGDTGRDTVIEFSVTDTGIGIPEEKLEDIFEKFSQADSSTSRKYGGTGLGLGISSRLVGAMGGNIKVESKENVGSTFYFTARFRPGQERVLSDEPASERIFSSLSDRPVRKLRALLVDDDIMNLRVVGRMLEKLGHEALKATGGGEAVRLAGTGEFDLIFMDVNMSGMDGFEATRRIRAREEESGSNRRPIIALTALALEGDRLRCMDAGMDDYLSKPIRTNDLTALIGKLFPHGATGMRTEGSPSPEGVAAGDKSVLFDRGVALKRFLGDEALLREMCEIFLSDLGENMDDIRAAIESRDCDAIEKSVHFIKGRLGYLASGAFIKTASELELMGRDRDIDRACELFDYFEESLLHLKEAIAEFLGEGDEGSCS